MQKKVNDFKGAVCGICVHFAAKRNLYATKCRGLQKERFLNDASYQGRRFPFPRIFLDKYFNICYTLYHIMKDEFSTFNLVKAFKDISRVSLQDWISRGYVHPTKKAHGHGDRARFTRQDVYALILFSRLVKFGLSRDVAGQFCQKFIKEEKQSQDPTQSIIFRIAKRKIYVTILSDLVRAKLNLTSADIEIGEISPGLIQKALPEPFTPGEWEQVHIINYGTIKEEVDQALKIFD